MAFDGSGNFTRYYGATGWTDDKNAATKILASRHDTHDQDLATAFNNCLTRDGQGKPSTNIDWNAKNLTNVASFSAVTATLTGATTSSSIIVTGSTIPANGLYLPAANTTGLASNTTLRWSVDAAGAHTFAAPTAGTSITINTVAGATALAIAGSTAGPAISISAGGGGATIALIEAAVRNWSIRSGGTATNVFDIADLTRGASVLQINQSGNITVSVPTSGVALTVTGTASNIGINATAAAATQAGVGIGQTGQTQWQVYQPASSSELRFYNGLDRLTFGTAGDITARGVQLVKIRTSDRSIASSNTIANDDVLTGITLPAGTHYFEAYLKFNNTGAAAAGFIFAFAFTGTLNQSGYSYIGGVNGAFVSSPSDFNAMTTSSGFTPILTTGVGDYLRVVGFITATTTGSFSLQWAQSSSNASATKLLLGSSLRVTVCS